jgi:hypothetical protein
MKKFMGVIVIIILAFAALIIYRKLNQTQNTVTQSILTTVGNYCLAKDLKADVVQSGAAGSIYSTFTLKNISDKTCSVLGGNFMQISYDSKLNNIKTTFIGSAQKRDFVLKPNDAIYSQTRYPNGPQCQEKTITTLVVFSYKISLNQTVNFANLQGQVGQTVQTCESEKEITEIQIWPMSKNPITQ